MIRSLLFVFFLAFRVCFCQVDQIVPLEYRFESPVPRNGSIAATIRWYDAPTGGVQLHAEQTILVIEAGTTTVYCGRSAPLPFDAVRGGPRWIGISLEGENERSPRVPIVPLFKAVSAQVADVADRLSSGASGVVTSINEQSGPIWFRGERGITIRKDSTTLTISGGVEKQRLSGFVMGSGSAEYDVQLPALPAHPHDVTVSVESPNTTIMVHVIDVLPLLPGIRIRAAAYVLPGERIRWSMIQR